MHIRSLVKAITHSRYILTSFDTKTKRHSLVEVMRQDTKIRSRKGVFYEMNTGDLCMTLTKEKYEAMMLKNK